MKYYARQIAPEHQTSPLEWGDFPENVYVFGNRHYIERTEGLREIREALENIAEAFEEMQRGEYIDSNANLHAVIWYEMPRDSGEGYTRAERMEIVQLAKDFASCIPESCEGVRTTVRALEIVRGEEYDSATIRGCCQGDWQEIIYPVRYGREWLEEFETEYFNTGTEWEIDDGDFDPETDCIDIINGFSVYCTSWNDDGQRQEIADAIGCDPSDVIMYAFDGYDHTPVYKEVCA